MAELDDDTPRELPERYRASTDPKDAAAFARLTENDAEQAELAKRFQAPMFASSPREAFRSKAVITIGEIGGSDVPKTPAVLERLAEAHATIGNYDKAEELATLAGRTDLATEYAKYWAAVWLPDEDWCPHPDQHKYIKEYVWSVREDREMPMMACNSCHTWNVLDAPGHLTSRESQQSEIAGQTTGMTIGDALAWHQKRFGGRR